MCAATALVLVGCGDDAPNRPCTTDTDCTLPAVCGVDQRCVTPDPAADGKPCAHPDHCESGVCFDAGNGGLCITPCGEPADCPVAAPRCLPLVGDTLPTGGKPAAKLLCQAPGTGVLHLGEACTVDADCASGICESGRCTRVCAKTCPGTMGCEPATLAGSLAASVCHPSLLQTLELGAVTVPATGLVTPLTFTIAAGVHSFMALADDKDNLIVALTRLEGPDGTVLVNRADGVALGEIDPRAFEYTGTATTQVPGTDQAQGAVKPGAYKLWVQTLSTDGNLTPVAGTVDRVAVLIRNAPQLGGLLDLDLHFSPGTGLTAAAAPTDPFVQGALMQLATLYNGLAGVGLGQVRFFDLPAEADAVQDWAEVIKLRVDHAQAGAHKLSANVFVVHDIVLPYVGLAGGIPGVPGLTARPISGVLVEKQSTAIKMGKLLGHELGHFLGLYHTTESEKAPFKNDTLGDTPECPSGTAIGDCPDHANLMFPYYLSTSDPLTLSRGQARVLRGSPFLYETVYPDACGPGIEVVDVTDSRFTGGSTALAADGTLRGVCGGSGPRERVHLLRLAQSGLKSLEVTAHSPDFAPVVYVLRGSCDGKGAELGCKAGQKGAATQTAIDAPEAGAYYIVVDADSGGGDYTLSVRTVSQ